MVLYIIHLLGKCFRKYMKIVSVICQMYKTVKLMHKWCCVDTTVYYALHLHKDVEMTSFIVCKTSTYVC